MRMSGADCAFAVPVRARTGPIRTTLDKYMKNQVSMDSITRVLIVDDDEGIRSLCQECLSGNGFEVAAAESGEQALEWVHESPFEVVITDLKLPGIDGIDLIEEISEKYPAPAIVAMTGKGTSKDAVELMRRGAFDVLPKPFGISELQLAAEKALKHQALRHQNEELQKKLQSSEKMAVIGRLAASVAHELNNPLDGVLRFVNLSLKRLPENTEEPIRYLGEAKTGLMRMAGIVQSLLKFSRNIVVEERPRALTDLVNESLSQMSHVLAGTNIDVVVDLREEEAWLPAGLVQVFTNLIKNAFDAMEKTGGLFTVRSLLVDDRIQIQFEDTGCGISEEQSKRIFEPFFTTKPFGKGTGLGLSICARILERFGGQISVVRGKELGTTFIVDVPRSPTPKSEEEEEEAAETGVPTS